MCAHSGKGSERWQAFRAARSDRLHRHLGQGSASRTVLPEPRRLHTRSHGHPSSSLGVQGWIQASVRSTRSRPAGEDQADGVRDRRTGQGHLRRQGGLPESRGLGRSTGAPSPRPDTPDNAPIVVASVGGEKEVEHRIIVPAVRAIVRDVTGGGYMEFPIMDKNGQPELNAEGKVMTVVRAPRVLDLLNNRAVLEAKILWTMQPEGQKAGVAIKEIRFGDPAIPPELLVARLREQLAQQLSASYKEEKLAQDDRVLTENARASADQQANLVEAQIQLDRARKLKDAAEQIGQGEKLKLTAIADGQKAQAAVLGQERVAELRKFELVVDRFFGLLEKNPDLITAALANAHKFVPNTVITTGEGAGLEGAASIFGTLLNASGTSPSGNGSDPERQ